MERRAGVHPSSWVNRLRASHWDQQFDGSRFVTIHRETATLPFHPEFSRARLDKQFRHLTDEDLSACTYSIVARRR